MGLMLYIYMFLEVGGDMFFLFMYVVYDVLFFVM